MTTERTDTPTPAGGDYYVTVWVRLPGPVEVDKRDANAVIVTEYTFDDKFVAETVGDWDPQNKVVESDAEFFARIGIPEDTSGDSTVIFVGAKGVAAARRLTAPKDRS